MRTAPFFLFLVVSVACLSVRVIYAQEEATLSSTPGAEVSANEGGSMELLSKLPVHLTLGVNGGYDDHVLSSGGGQGSYSAQGSVLLAYDLHGLVTGPFSGTSVRSNHASAALHSSLGGDNQPQLDIQAGSDFTYYTDVTRGRTSDLNVHLDSSGSFNLSRQITVGASAYAAYRTEPDFSANVGVENQRTNYFETFDNLSVSYHWSPRIDLVTSDDIQRVQYDSQSLSALDRFQNTIGEEYRFNFRPDLTLTAEYRYQIVDYDDSPRDSTTHYALAGFEKSVGPQFKIDLRGGATFRSFTQDGDRVDPHVESSVTYAGAHNAAVLWNTTYGIEESNSTQATNRKTFRTGLNFSYGLSSRIIGTLDGYYHHDDNESFPSSTPSVGATSHGFSQDAYDVSVSLRYAIKAYLTCDLDYQHSQVISGSGQGQGQGNQDYSRNRYSIGFRFTY